MIEILKSREFWGELLAILGSVALTGIFAWVWFKD